MTKRYRENVVDVLQNRNVLEYPVYTNSLIASTLRLKHARVGQATVNDLLVKMREENTDINWVELGRNNYAYWLPDEQMVKIPHGTIHIPKHRIQHVSTKKPRRFVIGWE